MYFRIIQSSAIGITAVT